MIKIDYSQEQKNEIESLYWKWFKKYHLKEFKDLIKKDNVFIRHIKLKLIDEDEIKAYIFAGPDTLAELVDNVDMDEQKIKKETEDYILKRYKNIRKTVAPKILEALSIKTCLYCNQNYVYSYNKKGIKCINGELDHFYNKSNYPDLAICLYNLIPCCSACNKLKSNQQFESINPYDSEAQYQSVFHTSFNDDIDLNYLIGLSNNFQIDINTNNASKEELEEIEKLSIKQRYQHIEKAKNIIVKSMMYNKLYVESVKKNFDIDMLEQSELLKYFFDIHERDSENSFSKFNKDILKEFIDFDF